MSPLLVLIVAVLATTYAGPIVRLAAAPAVAIAFWRLVLVLPVTFGVATRERQPTRAVREAFPLMLLSGLLLATHFWTWIASLKFTSVASSVLLVSLKPVFAWAVAALWLGEHPGRTERRGIAFGALAAGPMLIGHTGMNYALKHYRATTVNVAALGEPVGASVIAWLVPAIHEVPGFWTVIGGLLVLVGIAMSLKTGQGMERGHAD